MASNDNGDDKTKKPTVVKKEKKDKKNIVNFQDYKKKRVVSADSEEVSMDDFDNFMILADLDEDLAKVCLDKMFPDGMPAEIEGEYSYFIMGLRQGEDGENDNLLSVEDAADMIYEEMDFEEDYEVVLGELLETNMILEQVLQEKELMVLQIEKLEEELKAYKKKKPTKVVIKKGKKDE